MLKNYQQLIIEHLKNNGFIFQNSQIYNGLENAWDFGHLGVLLKNKLKQVWLDYFIHSQNQMYLIDTNIILNDLVWQASGHLANFNDPLIDCKKCKNRFRADKLIMQKMPELNVNESVQKEVLEDLIQNYKISCYVCQAYDWTEIKNFNLMFETAVGNGLHKKKVHLRPETAQGIFVNFHNFTKINNYKIPFGVAQIGKAFRNEITLGNFLFRMFEFEQMEIEFFFNPTDVFNWFDYFQKRIWTFLTKILEIKPKNLQVYEYKKEDLAFYSQKTTDFLFKFPHGWSELWGLADRSDYDLKKHAKLAKKNFNYVCLKTKQKFLPHIIEPSVGVERLLYALLVNAFTIENLPNAKTRIYLNLPYTLTPYHFCLLPLVNKLSEFAFNLYLKLKEKLVFITYDKNGSIGKRYYKQDAIGTFFCLTYDFDTINDHCLTVRDRNSMEQKRVKIEKINLSYLLGLFNYV